MAGSKRVQPTALHVVGLLLLNAAQIVLSPPAPRNGGPFLVFFGQAGQVDPLVGWHCCYYPTTFNNSRYTKNIPTDPCTVTTADIKANMRDIHTSIVSQHLAARDNNKILRTHPPQVSSTGENLHRHMRRTLAQLRTNESPFLLSYLHKIDASTHPSPLCPLCRTHEHTTQHLFSCPQIRTTLSALDLWRDPSGVAALLDDWREKLAQTPIRQQKRTPSNKQRVG